MFKKVRYFLVVQWIKIKLRLNYWWIKITSSLPIQRSAFAVIVIAIAGVLPMDRDILSVDGVTLFSTLAALLGGSLAISFSLKILLSQNAAERTSARFYSVLNADKHETWMYLTIVLLTLGFFVGAIYSSIDGGVYLPQTPWIAKIMVYSLGLAFWLQYEIYRNTQHRMNPFTCLRVIEAHCKKIISLHQKQAQNIAKIWLANPSLDKSVNPNTALSAAYTQLKGNMADIDFVIEELFNYHRKLLSFQDRFGAKQVIGVITRVICQYIEIRKDSSFRVPDGLPASILSAPVSDSRAFFMKHLPGYISVGIDYMKSSDDDGVTHVLYEMKKIVVATSEVNYIAGHPSNNPMFEQCQSYLFNLITEAITLNHEEAMFQGSQIAREIGAVGLKRNFIGTTERVAKLLFELGIPSLTHKGHVTWMQVLQELSAMAALEVDNTADAVGLKIHLEDIYFKLMVLVMGGLIAGLYKPLQGTSDAIFNALNNPYQMIVNLGRNVEATPELEENNTNEDVLGHKHPPYYKWQYKLFIVSEAYYEMLRKLNEQYPALLENRIINEISQSIASVATIFIKIRGREKWVDSDAQIEKNIRYFAYLPSFYLYKAKPEAKNLNSFDCLTQAMAKIAIVALNNNYETLGYELADVIASRTMSTLKESDNELVYKNMKYVCYIAMIALAKANNAEFDKLKEQIIVFETEYEAKFITPLPEGHFKRQHDKKPLVRLVDKLRDSLQSTPYEPNVIPGFINTEIDAFMHECITIKDFDWFTWKMWNYHASPSPIEADVAKELGLYDADPSEDVNE